jgi:Uma2 family endonuclease
MARNPLYQIDGPFYAESVREGDPYELSNGHPIECLLGGGRHSRANLTGGLVLETDPEVDSAGVNTGYASDPKTLRAPDIAVGNVPDEPGWVEGVPPLAVEYADSGQDEDDLRIKIDTLLAGGTRFIWVVRLSGPRQVEVYEPGKPRRTVRGGQQLQAPGVLKNPIPVEALYDTDIAHRTAPHCVICCSGRDTRTSMRCVMRAWKKGGKKAGIWGRFRGSKPWSCACSGIASSYPPPRSGTSPRLAWSSCEPSRMSCWS